LASAEVLPDVLVPDRLLRLRADAVQVAQGPGRVDALAVHRGCRPGAGEHESAGRLVREAPELLAAREVEDAKLVADLFVPVEQVDLAVADGRATEAGAPRHGPEDLRSCLRPAAQQPLLVGGVVTPRSKGPRPVRSGSAGDG